MQAPQGKLHDLGRNLRQLLRSPATWVLVIALVGLHTFRVLWVDDWVSYCQTFGLSREGFLAGKLWQVLSYAGVHGGWLHLLLNLLLNLLVGSRVEALTSKVSMFKVVLSGVVCGGLLHLALSDHILVGVSGGVMALLLYFTTLSPESVLLVPFKVSAKSLGRGVVSAGVLLMVMHPDDGVPGLRAVGQLMADHGMESIFKISHACHVGGAVAGWLWARWLLRPRVTLDRLRRARAKRERDVV